MGLRGVKAHGKHIYPLKPPPQPPTPSPKNVPDPRMCMYKHQLCPHTCKFDLAYQSLLHIKDVQKSLNGFEIHESCADIKYIFL